MRSRGNLLLLLLSIVLSLAAAEVVARGYWRFRMHASLLHPDRVLYAFYPELQEANRAHPTRDDGYEDILMLGGSTLHRDWGAIEKVLAERLAFAGHRRVRLHNLAREAHTSRDSRLKYEALPRARFDLVLFYDGINEARANNVPPQLFREDYGHYSWYRIVNAMAPYHGRARLALPMTGRLLATSAGMALHPGGYVPTAWPRQDWLRYGADLRSAVSFRRNLERVLSLAAERGDPVLLLTFATYVPRNYEKIEFKRGHLDYGTHAIPLEMWGDPKNVLAAVAAHNGVVRELAARTPGVHLVDEAQLLADQPRYFNDPCHLTVDGSIAFVDHAMPAVLAALGSPE